MHVRRSHELRCLAFPKTLQFTQNAHLSAALTSWRGVLKEEGAQNVRLRAAPTSWKGVLEEG